MTRYFYRSFKMASEEWKYAENPDDEIDERVDVEIIKQYPRTYEEYLERLKQSKDAPDWFSETSLVIFLLKTDDGYDISPERDGHQVLESFLICKKYFGEIDKVKDLLKICRTEKAVIKMFLRMCQKLLIPYHNYPFYFGLDKYLLDPTSSNFLPLSSMFNYPDYLHWKHVWLDHRSAEEREKHGDVNMTYYETFATEWFKYRTAAGDPYLPYEVLNSLQNSSMTTMTHCFVEAFGIIRSVRMFDEHMKAKLKMIVEYAKDWISAHPEELKRKDIADRTPLEKFNLQFMEDGKYSCEDEKMLCDKMRKALTC